MSEFARDTAIEALGPGRFGATLRPGWWIARGANGGYLAAILVDAMAESAQLPPRTLTIHYTGAPESGPVTIETQVLRRGRTLQTLRAQIVQGDQLIAVALGAFAEAREGPFFQRRRPPTAPPPEACPRFEGFHAFHKRWEYRWAFGSPPGAGGERALAGGWIRAADPTAADAKYLAAVCDAFSPPYFSTLPRSEIAPVPTIELTVHFRRTMPVAEVGPGDFLLARFESLGAAEGFVDEVGEVWTTDGVLLAESHQLATFLQGSQSDPRSEP